MNPRAGVLLIQDGRIALIERRRGDLRFWVFPGGGVDDGEDFETAARREAHEELGVEVELIGQAVRLRTPSEHRYWRARVVGGTFGRGHGQEVTRPSPWKGSYEAVWVDLADLEGLRIVPRSLARFTARAEESGWPHEEVTLLEWAWLERGPQRRSSDPFVGETIDVVGATLDDIPAWLELGTEVEQLFGQEMSEDPAFRRVLEKNIARGTAFVARECWGPAGVPLAGAMLWRPGANGVGWLAVGRRWRRRGVGSALLQEGLRLATEQPISVVTFTPDVRGAAPARAFYERHGFRPTGESPEQSRELFVR